MLGGRDFLGFCLFKKNVDDVTGYMFVNEKDLEERENDSTGEGTVFQKQCT